MKGLVKYIVRTTYKPLLVKYLSKTRTYSYKGISVEIPPEVFHPGFFHSTKLLLRSLIKMNLKEKKVLELGAGSGLLGIYAAHKGASVTATDINPIAIQCVKRNAVINGVEIDAFYSDVFEKIPGQYFDLILINPPYYKGNPQSASEYAWYCGENGEYFQKLFTHLDKYIDENSTVLMVLCDGCDLEMVKSFAFKNSFSLQCVYTSATLIERNYIFNVQPTR